MNNNRKLVTILMADDDADDRMITREALEEAGLANDLHMVEDGEELMDYLHHRGKYSNGVSSPRPSLILLDLNMPKKDGREALREIKNHPDLRRIPVVVFTTSKAATDISSSYDLGVNSYMTKPTKFSSLVGAVKGLGKYRFEMVELPPKEL